MNNKNINEINKTEEEIDIDKLVVEKEERARKEFELKKAEANTAIAIEALAEREAEKNSKDKKHKKKGNFAKKTVRRTAITAMAPLLLIGIACVIITIALMVSIYQAASSNILFAASLSSCGEDAACLLEKIDTNSKDRFGEN